MEKLFTILATVGSSAGRFDLTDSLLIVYGRKKVDRGLLGIAIKNGALLATAARVFLPTPTGTRRQGTGLVTGNRENLVGRVVAAGTPAGRR